jgi:hypothetical protein
MEVERPEIYSRISNNYLQYHQCFDEQIEKNLNLEEETLFKLEKMEKNIKRHLSNLLKLSSG